MAADRDAVLHALPREEVFNPAWQKDRKYSKNFAAQFVRERNAGDRKMPVAFYFEKVKEKVPGKFFESDRIIWVSADTIRVCKEAGHATATYKAAQLTAVVENGKATVVQFGSAQHDLKVPSADRLIKVLATVYYANTGVRVGPAEPQGKGGRVTRFVGAAGPTTRLSKRVSFADSERGESADMGSPSASPTSSAAASPIAAMSPAASDATVPVSPRGARERSVFVAATPAADAVAGGPATGAEAKQAVEDMLEEVEEIEEVEEVEEAEEEEGVQNTDGNPDGDNTGTDTAAHLAAPPAHRTESGVSEQDAKNVSASSEVSQASSAMRPPLPLAPTAAHAGGGSVDAHGGPRESEEEELMEEEVEEEVVEDDDDDHRVSASTDAAHVDSPTSPRGAGRPGFAAISHGSSGTLARRVGDVDPEGGESQLPTDVQDVPSDAYSELSSSDDGGRSGDAEGAEEDSVQRGVPDGGDEGDGTNIAGGGDAEGAVLLEPPAADESRAGQEGGSCGDDGDVPPAESTLSDVVLSRESSMHVAAAGSPVLDDAAGVGVPAIAGGEDAERPQSPTLPLRSQMQQQQQQEQQQEQQQQSDDLPPKEKNALFIKPIYREDGARRRTPRTRRRSAPQPATGDPSDPAAGKMFRVANKSKSLSSILAGAGEGAPATGSAGTATPRTNPPPRAAPTPAATGGGAAAAAATDAQPRGVLPSQVPPAADERPYLSPRYWRAETAPFGYPPIDGGGGGSGVGVGDETATDPPSSSADSQRMGRPPTGGGDGPLPPTVSLSDAVGTISKVLVHLQHSIEECSPLRSRSPSPSPRAASRERPSPIKDPARVLRRQRSRERAKEAAATATAAAPVNSPSTASVVSRKSSRKSLASRRSAASTLPPVPPAAPASIASSVVSQDNTLGSPRSIISTTSSAGRSSAIVVEKKTGMKSKKTRVEVYFQPGFTEVEDSRGGPMASLTSYNLSQEELSRQRVVDDDAEQARVAAAAAAAVAREGEEEEDLDEEGDVEEETEDDKEEEERAEIITEEPADTAEREERARAEATAAAAARRAQQEQQEHRDAVGELATAERVGRTVIAAEADAVGAWVLDTAARDRGAAMEQQRMRVERDNEREEREREERERIERERQEAEAAATAAAAAEAERERLRAHELEEQQLRQQREREAAEAAKREREREHAQQQQQQQQLATRRPDHATTSPAHESIFAPPPSLQGNAGSGHATRCGSPGRSRLPLPTVKELLASPRAPAAANASITVVGSPLPPPRYQQNHNNHASPPAHTPTPQRHGVGGGFAPRGAAPQPPHPETLYPVGASPPQHGVGGGGGYWQVQPPVVPSPSTSAAGAGGYTVAGPQQQQQQQQPYQHSEPAFSRAPDLRPDVMGGVGGGAGGDGSPLGGWEGAVPAELPADPGGRRGGARAGVSKAAAAVAASPRRWGTPGGGNARSATPNQTPTPQELRFAATGSPSPNGGRRGAGPYEEQLVPVHPSPHAPPPYASSPPQQPPRRVGASWAASPPQAQHPAHRQPAHHIPQLIDRTANFVSVNVGGAAARRSISSDAGASSSHPSQRSPSANGGGRPADAWAAVRSLSQQNLKGVGSAERLQPHRSRQGEHGHGRARGLDNITPSKYPSAEMPPSAAVCARFASGSAPGGAAPTVGFANGGGSHAAQPMAPAPAPPPSSGESSRRSVSATPSSPAARFPPHAGGGRGGVAPAAPYPHTPPRGFDTSFTPPQPRAQNDYTAFTNLPGTPMLKPKAAGGPRER